MIPIGGVRRARPSGDLNAVAGRQPGLDRGKMTSTRRAVLTAAAAVAAAGAIGTVLTLTVVTSTSTRLLDDPAPVSAAGAFSTASPPAEIVAGRILSRYHPLPWVGESHVTCDVPLVATGHARIIAGVVLDVWRLVDLLIDEMSGLLMNSR